MIKIAATGGAAAAGVGARALPGPDEVGNVGRRPVRRGAAVVAAGPGFQELHASAQLGGPPDRRTGA